MATSTTTTTTTTASKPRIRRLADGLYVVESKSQPGIGRQVDIVRGLCSCPAGKHGRRCYHLTWAREYDDCRRRVLTHQQPAAPRAAAVPTPPQQPDPVVALSSFFE